MFFRIKVTFNVKILEELSSVFLNASNFALWHLFYFLFYFILFHFHCWYFDVLLVAVLLLYLLLCKALWSSELFSMCYINKVDIDIDTSLPSSRPRCIQSPAAFSGPVWYQPGLQPQQELVPPGQRRHVHRPEPPQTVGPKPPPQQSRCSQEGQGSRWSWGTMMHDDALSHTHTHYCKCLTIENEHITTQR